MRRLVRWGLGVVLAAGLTQVATGQARPLPSGDLKKTYERLLKQIDAIPMYDNHAHPGYADDTDVDAMASPPDESATLRLRDDNPEFVAGAKALFQYPYDDFKPEHAKWLADKKKAAEAAGGVEYFNQLLDKLNVEICLANRAMMAPYLDGKRYHWVCSARVQRYCRLRARTTRPPRADRNTVFWTSARPSGCWISLRFTGGVPCARR